MYSPVQVTTRYRLVNLQTGQVVIVFQRYPDTSVVKSCQIACEEFEIDTPSGSYRLDRMYQTKRGTLHWLKMYTITLKGV